jgi:glycosyltransferase involved in cell wall biosynthesis
MEKGNSKNGLQAINESDKENPLISVVTCFLNVERYLEESIQSVISQKYPNWELLLVDDGSTDGGTEIAKSFADKYRNIYYLQHPNHLNQGLSASRILAVNNAKGKIITFLDGDDVWTPEFLSNAFQKKKKEEVPFYCEATKYWYSWKFPNKPDEVNQVGAESNRTYDPPELIYRLYPLALGASPAVCSILVDISTLEKHGGFNAAFKGMYEDQVFLSKMYLHEKIYISSDCNNIYRQRHDSLVYTAKSKGTNLQDRKFFLDWFEEYVNSIENHDKKLRKMLSKAYFPYRHPKFFYLKEILPSKVKRKLKKLFR